MICICFTNFVFRSSRFQYPKFSYVFLEKPMSSYSGRAGRRNNNIPENRYYSKAQAGISISLVDEDLLLPLLPCSAQVRFRLNSKWIIGNSCFRNTALNCRIYLVRIHLQTQKIISSRKTFWKLQLSCLSTLEDKFHIF